MMVQGEKGLVLFNFYMMTPGTTVFLSSVSVLFIDAGNSGLAWLNRIHRAFFLCILYLFDSLFLLYLFGFIPVIGLKVFILAF